MKSFKFITLGVKMKSSPKNWDANYYLGICKTKEWSESRV